MSSHNDNFINSDNTIHTFDNDKIAKLKAAIATNNHVFVFIYMNGCGHCVAAETAWLEFTKDADKRPNVDAFAISKDIEVGPAIGDAPIGFPTFRYIYNDNVTEYDGDRSVEEFNKWMNEKLPSQTGGRRNKRSRKKRKTRKTRKTRKMRKTRKTRKRN